MRWYTVKFEAKFTGEERYERVQAENEAAARAIIERNHPGATILFIAERTPADPDERAERELADRLKSWAWLALVLWPVGVVTGAIAVVSVCRTRGNYGYDAALASGITVGLHFLVVRPLIAAFILRIGLFG
ncbi:MAG: hypothetical protein JJU33_02135 [Phycisphaerales bacterium]|nr:hypothetical protein [Phycisphaerales bacterium]